MTSLAAVILRFVFHHANLLLCVVAVILRFVFHHANLLLCVVKLWLCFIGFQYFGFSIRPLFDLISPFDHHLLRDLWTELFAIRRH